MDSEATGVSPFAIPVLVTAGITLYVGVYHGVLYLRRQRRQDLSFALSCLVIFAYVLLCAGLYSAGSLAEGAAWQRAQIIALALATPAFAWFVYDYTGRVSRGWLAIVTVYALFYSALALFDESGLVWTQDEAIKHVSLPFLGSITYYELLPGPATNLQSAVGLGSLLYFLWVGARLYREGERRKSRQLLLALGLLAAGVVNDMLVSLGVYAFVYLIEYAYLGMVVVVAYGLSSEVVEAAEMRDALAEKEESLAITLHSIGDAVVATDRDGRVTRLNPTAERLTGWTAAEALGRPLPELLRLVDAVDGKPVEDPAARVLRSGRGGPVGEGVRLAARDGTVREIADSGAPITDRDGNTVGVVLVFRDVTEERRLGDELRQAQKLESMGRLAGGIAHDFNNLLTPIMGHADMALLSLEPESPARVDVVQVRAAATRAAELTRQILAFGRKQVLDVRVLDLNETLAEMEGMLQHLIREDVTLEFHTAEEAGSVRADRSQLQQIVLNLVVNARDAMPAGGQIEIESGRDEVKAEGGELAPGRYVTLCVSDTGGGMDAATRERVFEPFFTTKERGQGTGLGLATVEGIVSQHGGHITVESEPGRGSRFRIWLPEVTGRVDRTRTEAPAAAAQRGTETVLVVEDDDMVRRLAREVLAQQGYRVLSASHPAEALDLARRHEGDVALLLTDVVMPGMNGRDLYVELCRTRPALRALYMSGYNEEVVGRSGVLEADIDFLAKPFRVESLGRKVREVLDAD
ncbi:MAG: ATP-binding protein [Proteobacteria bacterium]|nr:ATP-binding protein [Pseudomonadota bacterium]